MWAGGAAEVVLDGEVVEDDSPRKLVRGFGADLMQVDLTPGRTRRKNHLHQVDVTQASPGPRGRCDAIECKWQGASYSPKALAAFRALHPEGRNYVITPQVEPAYVRDFRGLPVVFCSLGQWETGEAERTLGRRPPP